MAKGDSTTGYDWEESLAYCENLELAGYDDWRIPNVKELQSIVDYSRSIQTSDSAAINPLFEITEITNPAGSKQFPSYWSGTSHLDGQDPYSYGCYVSFGEGLGRMNGTLMDVHGAGSQRSDPKSGSKDEYPKYHGPQGDIQIVYNFVKAVRSVEIEN